MELKMKYIIIGNGPAGTTASSKIRNLDKNADITVFSYTKNIPIMQDPGSRN